MDELIEGLKAIDKHLELVMTDISGHHLQVARLTCEKLLIKCVTKEIMKGTLCGLEE